MFADKEAKGLLTNNTEYRVQFKIPYKNGQVLRDESGRMQKLQVSFCCLVLPFLIRFFSQGDIGARGTHNHNAVAEPHEHFGQSQHLEGPFGRINFQTLP
jgi:hypothetical protein